MKEDYQTIYRKTLSAFLAVIFALEAGSVAAMAGMPAVAMAADVENTGAETVDTAAESLYVGEEPEQKAAVSENSRKNENGWEIGKEGEDPLETYNGIPTEWLNESEESIYNPESGNYLTRDAFYRASTKKGIPVSYTHLRAHETSV